MPTIKFFTLGCKVNQYDTQCLREKFLTQGIKELKNNSKADIYLINTCTVTSHADTESLNLIRRARRKNPKAKIIVTGCLVESDVSKIRQTDNKATIIKRKEKEKLLKEISDFSGHTRAFLKIQDGCDNFCSYCKVPLVRGRSRSRKPEIIIKEAQNLVKNGFKEIVLCGICLGSFGKDLKPKSNLVRLIKELEKISGLLRIRLSSIEAGDVSDDLIKLISYSQKLCSHLHIPIQSGDDQVLKKMKRSYSSDDYLKLIRKIRKVVPGIAITTDVLIGFPGESENNFQNTVNLVKKILPLKAHIFPFSKREGTAAAKMFDQLIPPEIIKRRVSVLKNIAEKSAQKYRGKFLNKKMDVLIEGRAKDCPDYWQGYSGNYLKVRFKSSRRDLKNKLVSVRLKRAENGSIYA